MWTQINVITVLSLVVDFIISFVFTFFAMPFVIRFCKKKKLYDMPGGRKVHHNAIPRLGGSLFTPAIFVSMISVLIIRYGTELIIIHATSVIMAIGILIIYFVGLVDDVVGVKAKHKFLFQLVASSFMPFCGLYLNNFYGFLGLHEIPFWLGAPLTVFVSLLIVNAVNLIDGIDGLASSLSIFALGAFAYLFIREQAWPYGFFALGLMGSVVAFFYFNFFGSVTKGSKIFMGDSGSLILGYALAYLSIKYAMSNPLIKPDRTYALLASLTIMLVPTFDLVRVSFARLFRGFPIFKADKTHLHHKLMDCGLSMHSALYSILGIFLLFCLLNLVWVKLFPSVPMLVVLIDIVVYAIIDYLLNYSMMKHRQKMSLQ